MKKKNKFLKYGVILALLLVIGGCLYKNVTNVKEQFTGLLGTGNSFVDDVPSEEYYSILPIKGTIQSGNPNDGVSYNHTWLMDRVDELMEDENNKAIMLEISSGGGTVYHSDEMYLKLMEYKRETGRPIYAYIEEMGASGAYYIACAADKIFANRNSTVGSIGVIISFVSTKELYDKIGLEQVMITTGANKGMGAAGTDLTEEQRAIYQSIIDESYDTFVSIVSAARDMDNDKVRKIADGRIYTAKQSNTNGLIDGVMDYDLMINEMQELTGTTNGYKEFYDYELSFYDMLFSKIEQVTPKSDMEVMQEMITSDLAGLPLYMYQY